MNPEEAKFCEKCGKPISDHITPMNSIKKNSNYYMGFRRWWNKQSLGKQATLFIGGLLGLFLIIGIITFVIVIGYTVSHSYTATNAPSITSNNIIVLNNSTGRPDGKYYKIKGTIYNNNSYDADFVKIIIKTYDNNGKLVKQDFCYAYYGYDTRIPAKNYGEFEKSFEDPNGLIIKYEVSIGSASKAEQSITSTTSTPQIGGQEDKAISIVKNYGNGWATIQDALEKTTKTSENSGNYIIGGLWAATAIDSSNYKVVYNVQENGITTEAIFKVNIDTGTVSGMNKLGEDTVAVAET